MYSEIGQNENDSLENIVTFHHILVRMGRDTTLTFTEG